MSDPLFKTSIMTFLIAMTPVLELRAAIPAGVIGGLSVDQALIIAILGNMVPVPFIIVFVRRILKWLKEKSPKLGDWARKLEEKADSKKEQVLKYEFWGLMILVAIPLPGTGAWTGALVAAMLDMQLKRAIPAIGLGVVLAGLLVALATYGVSSVF